MKTFRRLALAAFGLVAAASAAALDISTPAPDDKAPLAPYLGEKRPVVIFADNDRDPRLDRQLRALEREAKELEDRDVIILVDTTPGPSRFDTTPMRERFRPHGFNILLVDKDGSVKMRRPNVVSANDVMRMIDRTPLRQQEMGRR